MGPHAIPGLGDTSARWWRTGLAEDQDGGAVIGIKDPLKGEQACGFVVLKAGRPHAEIEKEIVGLVRERIGPVAAFKIAIVVSRLPKTRSGKIVRGTMKKIADGDPWTMPATIDDPMILDEIAQGLMEHGIRLRKNSSDSER
jgi:propionyl-CoA synthetase